MLRFSGKQKNKPYGFLLYIAVFLLVIVLFCFAADSIASGTSDEQMDYLENAVRRKAVYCYSVEGAYPESVEYIEQNYGLSYDKDSFYIGYRLQASNLMPDITVIDIRSR